MHPVTPTRTVAAIMLVLIAVLLAGCSGNSGVKLQTVPGKSSAPASPTIDPNAQAAITAYEAFDAAGSEAQRHPVAVGGPYPAGADFTKYSVAPIRKLYEEFIGSLVKADSTFGGKPTHPRIRVADVDMDAASGPRVTLVNCQSVDGDWHQFKHGKEVARPKYKVPEPYSARITMVFVENHWAAKTVDVDQSRTCTP